MLPSSYWPLPSLNNSLHFAVEEERKSYLLASSTMLQSIEVARTQEILSRFRPIAPKPSLPQPQLVPRSPSVELQLRSRPCRARKRRRPSPAPLPLSKRPKRRTSGGDLTTLSLLPTSPEPEMDVPVEQDLLQKLQEPRVIIPQPLRPVASTITVVCIIGDLGTAGGGSVHALPEEVEEELESDYLPAVISDSRNRVRLANWAYKEMVGQPECPWLDAMMAASGGGRPRRIGGEVILEVGESTLPKSSKGFSCRVKIEWASDGKMNCVEAPCEVKRLFCHSKDYCLAWRFITTA